LIEALKHLRRTVLVEALKQLHLQCQKLTGFVTNRRGQQRQFEYDAAGRITRWIDPDGSVSFTYDANGNFNEITNYV